MAVIIAPTVLIGGYIAKRKGVDLPGFLEFAVFACFAAIVMGVNIWKFRVKCPDCGGKVLERYLMEKSSNTGKDIMTGNHIRSNCADCGRSFSQPYADQDATSKRPKSPPNGT